MAKQMLNRIVHSGAGMRFMSLLEQSVPQRPNYLQVLTYHRVLEADAFERQMAYVDANYNVISMAELLDAVRSGKPLAPGSLTITFDDAYIDFADCAWPIMKRYELPATLFVPTAFPDNPSRVFWWDRLQYALEHTPRRDMLDTPAGRLPLKTAQQRYEAYRRVRDYVKKLPYSELLSWTHQICSTLGAPPAPHQVLSWQALRHLAQEGVTLGAHTRHHRFMDQLSPEEIEEEVKGSFQDLKKQIGAVLPIFAYPDGRFNEDVVRCLKTTGVEIAFTTRRGTNNMAQADTLRLRRINVGPRATRPVLQARLLQTALPIYLGN